MTTIHIAEAEAERNFAAVMAHVDEGSEVIIERDANPFAVVRRATAQPGILLSEAIALANARGFSATIDEAFANDLKAPFEDHNEMLSSPPRRTIEECIALLPENSTATIDEDFARDVEAAIAAHREPLNSTPWD
jgi:hypothetical protein